MKNLKGTISNHMLLAVLGIVVVAILGTFYVAFSLAPTTKSISPTGSTSVAPSATLACVTGSNQNFLASVAYPDYSKTPQQQTLVASQTINFYAQQPYISTTPTQTASSLSTAGVTSGNLQCGTTYLVTAGDQSTYFLNYTFATMASGGQTVLVLAPKYSAPTINFANSSTATMNTTARYHNWAASKPTTVYMTLQAGQYHAAEGAGASSFTFNSGDMQIQSVGGIGPSTTAYVPSLSYVTSNAICPSGNSAASCYPAIQGIGVQNSQLNFIFPSFQDFQYATASGPSGSYTLIPIAVTSTSGWTGGVNEVISYQFTPGTYFFNTSQGKIVGPVFRNPLTGANIWAPVISGNIIFRSGW